MIDHRRMEKDNFALMDNNGSHAAAMNRHCPGKVDFAYSRLYVDTCTLCTLFEGGWVHFMPFS